MNKIPSLLAVALLACTAGAALAQAEPAKADAPKLRNALDVNGDGVIDRSEAAAHPRLAERFDALDANKDGRLERDEMRRHWRGHHRNHGRRGPGGHPFMQLDADKDGRISKAEAATDAKFAARFERMDVNADGFIDRADRQAAASQRRDAWFASADSNGDGSLSKAEYDAAHARHAEARSRHRGSKDHGRRGPARLKDAPAQ